MSDLLLHEYVTVRAPRKCGHCKDTGHNLLTCDVLTIYMNELYQTALEKIQLDVLEKENGYLFEKWIDELQSYQLKCLVSKITDNRTDTYDFSLEHCKNIIFTHYDSLNIGYVLQSIRSIRNYNTIYQYIQSTHCTDIELELYLNNEMSKYEVNDIFSKIHTDNRVSFTNDNPTFCREFHHWFRQPGIPYKHLVIHCHFTDLNIGYHFQTQNIIASLSSSSPPLNNNIRFVITPFNDDENKTDVLSMIYTNRDSIYQMDYNLLKITKNQKEIETFSDCAVCMENIETKKYLTTNCNHDFCNKCIGKMMVNSLTQSKSFHCPLCRNLITKLEYCEDTTIYNILSSSSSSSSL
jgi:hypothetical protein